MTPTMVAVLESPASYCEPCLTGCQNYIVKCYVVLDTRTEFNVHLMHIGRIHTWIRFGAMQI